MRLSLCDRIGSGAFADIFSPAPGDTAFKLFRRIKEGALAGVAPFVFRAEVAAYEIAQNNQYLRDHSVAFYGQVGVSAVVDRRGRNIGSRYWLDLCYAMQRLPDDPEERKFGSFFNDAEGDSMQLLERAFEDAGIKHLGDASVLHWRSGRPVLIDFAVSDAAADHAKI
jgi:hypothetical protein